MSVTSTLEDRVVVANEVDCVLTLVVFVAGEGLRGLSTKRSALMCPAFKCSNSCRG